MGQKKPFFSIIIPTYNRPKQLATCLQALAHLVDYPRDRFEVIVVDDGGKIPLEAVVATFFNRIDVTLVTQKNAGPASARNNGAAQAKGQFLAFTDDDCVPASNWIQALAARFSRVKRQAIISGRTVNALLSNQFSAASQLLIDYLYHYHNSDPNQAQFSTGNNLAIRANAFHAIGGFNKNLALGAGEDREFCDRWLYHGYRLVYAQEVIVYHFNKLTFNNFLRQHFNYGRGSFQFHKVRSRRDKRQIKLEPLSFYLNLLFYPFFKACGRRAPILSALLLISQVSNAMGFLVELMTCRASKRSRIEIN